MSTESKNQLLYHVYVSDRLAQDSDSATTSSAYLTLDEAIRSAKRIVDDQLEADFAKNPDDRPLMLLDGLLDFGFLPSVSGPSGAHFNVRGYAEQKCYELKGLEPPASLVWGGPNV